MSVSDLLNAASAVGGSAGAVALSLPEGRTLFSEGEDDRLPLASSGKLPVAWAAAKAVGTGALAWGQVIGGLAMQRGHECEQVYPHLSTRTELELRDAVEVMVACADQGYATMIARLLGGWDEVQRRVASAYLAMRVSVDTMDTERNSAPLSSAAQLALDIGRGYRNDPRIWLPVVTGMLRWRFKVDDVPPHLVFNVQGGGGGSAVDFGVLGDLATGPAVAYAVGIKGIPDDHMEGVYESAERVIRSIFREHIGPHLTTG